MKAVLRFERVACGGLQEGAVAGGVDGQGHGAGQGAPDLDSHVSS